MNKQPSIKSSAKKSSHVRSPCVDICKYNQHNYCVGCKRHSDEITDWINYSDAMREAITPKGRLRTARFSTEKY